jgi:AcrR family transcriptional regulator
MKNIRDSSADKSAEQKIIEAARILFTQKGYSEIKTRDIAKKAGINIALLNYYFRSKEKLFEIVSRENFEEFIQVIAQIVNGQKTDIWQKIELLVKNYIEMLTLNPDMPLFVLTQTKQDPQRMKMRQKITESYFMKQVQVAIKSGEINPINPNQLIMNILSLTIFPFAGRHILQNNNGISLKQFNKLMQERKKMIPVWIKAMLKAKP